MLHPAGKPHGISRMHLFPIDFFLSDYHLSSLESGWKYVLMFQNPAAPNTSIKLIETQDKTDGWIIA